MKALQFSVFGSGMQVKPVEGDGKLDPKFCVQFLDAASKTGHFTPHRPSGPWKLHPGTEKAQTCANTHNWVLLHSTTFTLGSCTLLLYTNNPTYNIPCWPH